MKAVFACFLLAGLALAGCNQRPTQSPDAALLEKLRAENQEVQRLKTANADLPDLRQESAEVQQLKKVAAEVEKLRAENDQLRKQIAAGGDTGGATLAAAATGGPAEAQSSAAGAAGADSKEKESLDAAKEGDEILIPPNMLGAIIPGMDASKIERKEPIMINDLLKNQGITLTNYQQLRDLGITNFIIRRAPVSAAQ